LAIIVGAIVIMQVYIKRGVQGRFRESADDIGEQFDPGHQTYVSASKSYSNVSETTDKTGLETQNIRNQTTYRWGNTTTTHLGDTTWDVPTK
jgi:hypothetical protein